MDKKIILRNWNQYISQKLMKLIKTELEGNIYSIHKNKNKADILNVKQLNIIELMSKTKPHNILEIGFNAGFSALLMLMSKNDVTLTCIDINDHPYVVPCYQQLCQDFKNITLITQSSHIVLPKLIHEGKKYDLIHIDGDHSPNGAKNDFDQCVKLCHKGSIIILDDTNIPYLNELCELSIKNHLFKDYIFNKLEGTTYSHRFMEYIKICS